MTRPDFTRRLRAGERVHGTFLNMASPISTEIAGRIGFDWVMLDLEHGCGDFAQLLTQLQILEHEPVARLVRVTWNEAWQVKRVLDAGADGVMIPYVSTAEEARRAVAAMRYPPEGMRGVAGYTRAGKFSTAFKEHFAVANRELVTIVQIETAEAMDNLEEIAAVEGVDVLFVGPADLSVGLGVPLDYNHATYRAAVKRVAEVTRAAGKVSGILAFAPELLERAVEDGYTLLGYGSDSDTVVQGLRGYMNLFGRV